MTEPTIPSWEEIRKSHISIEKRDPRLDEARRSASDRIDDMDQFDDISKDVVQTQYNNPVVRNIFSEDGVVDRNPVPTPQPERKDIPYKRDMYERDQDAAAKFAESMIDPDRVRNRLVRLYDYYRNKAEVAGQGREKTSEALGLPTSTIDPKVQRVLIQPGRR